MKFFVALAIVFNATVSAAVIVVGIPNNIQRFDPLSSVTAHTRYALQLIFENLVKMDLNQEIRPELAKTWTIDRKRKQIILTLNENRYFSDGSRITATDVVRSIVEICGPASYARPELFALKGCGAGHNPSIRAISPSQVIMKSEDDPGFLLYQLTGLRVLIFKRAGKKFIGSGPYILSKIDGSEMYLTPNRYWNRKVKNNGLLFKFYDDEKKLMAGLRRQFIDVSLVTLSTDDSNSVKMHYNLVRDLATITELLVFNNKRYPFTDKGIRESILYLIEQKNAELAACRGGNSKKAIGIVPIGLGGTIAHLALVPLAIGVRPLKKARKGTVIELHQHIGRKNKCQTDILSEIFAKLNIKLTVEYHNSYKTLWPLYLNHNLDGSIELYNFKNRDAYTVLMYFISRNNPENRANIYDPKLDELIENAGKTPNPRGRFYWYRKANEYIRQKAYVAPLDYSATNNYYHKCLSGVFHNPGFNPFPGLVNLSDRKCMNRSGRHNE